MLAAMGSRSQGGWKANAVREGFCKVVEQPSRPSMDTRLHRLVIVDEIRTSRVSSSVHARQPCELHLPPDRPRPADWVPLVCQVKQRLVRIVWSQRHAKCVRGLKWCHEVPPNPPPPPPAPHHPAPTQDPPPAPAQAQPPSPAQDQPPAQPPPGPVQRPQAPPWGRWLDRDTNPCLNFQRFGESKQCPLELCSWKDLKALPPVGKEYQQAYKLVNDRLPKVKQRLHRAADYRACGDRTLEQFFKKLEEDMAEVSMERHGHAKHLVVFFGAASIGTGGGWGADAVLRACCKVVCRPRGTDQRRGRVVLVDEHRTTRISSVVNGQQPCERQLNKRRATRPAGWKPPAGQVEPRLLRPAWSQQRDQPVRGMMWCPVVAPRKPPQAPRSSQAATQAAASEPGPSTPLPAKRSKRTKAEPEAAEPSQPTKGKGKAQGKAAKAKPAPQPGSAEHAAYWESKWRPLELCFWPDQGALPAKGKEYPGLGYKRLRDKPSTAQQQQPAVAQ
ncbi:hypothetical protein QJQ45_003042 [Haematococcus lacustris]|nr:hypothetical protein QJQ45_003042 [Haematococcus lacustris]